jgi:hypothetical protein
MRELATSAVSYKRVIPSYARAAGLVNDNYKRLPSYCLAPLGPSPHDPFVRTCVVVCLARGLFQGVAQLHVRRAHSKLLNGILCRRRVRNPRDYPASPRANYVRSAPPQSSVRPLFQSLDKR